MKIVRDLGIVIILGVIALFLIGSVRTAREDDFVEEEEIVVEVEVQTSGISGHVSVGPSCPVVGLGIECDDSPYQGIVDFVVNDPERELIVRVSTDENGVFSTAIPAGSYVVLIQTEGPFPRCPEEEVIVEEGSMADIAIVCDSGIR